MGLGLRNSQSDEDLCPTFPNAGVCKDKYIANCEVLRRGGDGKRVGAIDGLKLN